MLILLNWIIELKVIYYVVVNSEIIKKSGIEVVKHAECAAKALN